MTDPSTDLDGARERLAELLSLAERDPATVVAAALDDLAVVRALVLMAKQDLAGLERLKLRLRQAGVRAADIAALTRVITRCLTRGAAPVPGQPATDAVPVRRVLPDAPVGNAVVVPNGWALSTAGLFTYGGERVSSSPIVLVRRHIDVHSGDELLTIAWRRSGQWQEEIVERSTIAGGGRLLKLADRGLPVTTGTKGMLVAYLTDFETANLESLPAGAVAHRVGWIDQGFLLGREYIADDGARPIEFAARDHGEEQMIGSISRRGSYDSWLRAAEIASRHPAVSIALYVSFVPPLLEILQAPNFVFELAGRTSGGKTTTLQLCASVWGSPDLRSTGAFLRSWDITRVFGERTASLFSGLPVVLDDTKRITDPKLATTIIYDVVAGHGRGRGSVAGMRRSESWRTVLISSGEAPLTAFTQDGGTRARTLSLWGSPFGDDQQGEVVQALGADVCRNYGHAGARFVNFLVRSRNRWPEFRGLYQAAHDRYLRRAEGNAVAGRMAAYFASIDVAAQLAHEALSLPWQYADPVASLWTELVADTEEADPAVRALGYVRAWAASHEAAFFGRHHADARGRSRSPAGGWAGAWPAGPDWTWIGFLPMRLDELLRQSGFEPAAVRRSWRDAGWIALDAAAKGTVPTRIGGHVERMVRLSRAALELGVTATSEDFAQSDQELADG